jgi:sulfotransferase
MKKLVFVSGLPRSGSTLLLNILAQNPDFQVAGTSGLVDVLLMVRNQWDQLPEMKAMDPVESEAAKGRVLQAMLASYHLTGSVAIRGGQTPKTVFDKSRTWLAHLEMAEYLMGAKAKVLVPIRDIRDILASMELLWRKVSPTRQIPYEARSYLQFQSAPGRCQAWMAADGLVGIAYGRVRDALTRGFADRLHFVDYASLTEMPKWKMEAIYSFLEIEPFKHQFEDVEPVVKEDDFAYGFPGLHESRRKVEPNPSKWKEVLGVVAEPYGVLNNYQG